MSGRLQVQNIEEDIYDYKRIGKHVERIQMNNDQK
jgi:hypothetical protein